MSVGKLISGSNEQQWFTLEQLMESVLADVISTDANFQLTQTKAWSDFGKSLNEFEQIPMVDRLDFSVGFGRLENLGLQDVAFDIPLEMYKPSWMKKVWWGIIRIFGVKRQLGTDKFRVANKLSNTHIQLSIKAKRDQYGHWQVNTNKDPQNIENK